MHSGSRSLCQVLPALPTLPTTPQTSRTQLSRPSRCSRRFSHQSFASLHTKYVRLSKPGISTQNHSQGEISNLRQKQNRNEGLTQDVPIRTIREVKQYEDSLASFSTIINRRKRRIKHLKPSTPKPISVTSSETSVTKVCEKNSVKVIPVLCVFTVNSDDLREDKSELDAAVTHLKGEKSAKKANMLTTPLQSPKKRTETSCYSVKVSYCEDTARVLSDTRTLAKRRSVKNILSGRLFRHIHCHSFC